uniref:KID domain-containing protein n=1 Tax=Steinernema glaseri TaxID=37863 RepID=A0A1I7YEP0_9BILA
MEQMGCTTSSNSDTVIVDRIRVKSHFNNSNSSPSVKFSHHPTFVVNTDQPITNRRAITAERRKDDFDTSSENSFVVVRRAVKVAWERETYQKLALESKQNRNLSLNPVVQSSSPEVAVQYRPIRDNHEEITALPISRLAADFGSVVVEDL